MTAPLSSQRMVYLDNLKVLLTVLVVLHHTAITYSGTGGWYYKEGLQDGLTVAVLGQLCAINQAFFMALFFFVSTYFTPGSYERKGAGRFLWDRFLRLGIPLVIYDFIVHPLVLYLRILFLEGTDQSIWSLYLHYLENFPGIGRGPLWFIETLLFFSIIYVLVRMIFDHSRQQSTTPSRLPPVRWGIVFALLMGLVAFVLRIFLPVGTNWEVLNLQIPFYPLYIAAMVLGVVAYRQQWLTGLSWPKGRSWFYLVLGCVLAFGPVLIVGGALDGELESFMGGVDIRALFYAVWEALMCVAMCAGLVAWFHHRFNLEGRWGRILSANAYAVYLIHAPIVVLTGLLLRDLELHPLLKFPIAALVAVPSCFVLSHWVIRKLPGATRIV